ncbi:hypothetical protein ASE48_07625 [Mycobacterium sp. Root265]|nr:hypothetical protein ASE48_07625 [Mycobacterium sp. Root265]
MSGTAIAGTATTDTGAITGSATTGAARAGAAALGAAVITCDSSTATDSFFASVAGADFISGAAVDADLATGALTSRGARDSAVLRWS